MPDDILARIQERQQLQDNAALQQADHNAYWADTFKSIPPPEVQRSRMDLANTMDRVVNNRLRMAAQNDEKALHLLERTEHFKEWQAQAPLREELLKNRIESTGAMARFNAQKDAETMKDLSGFFSHMEKAPPVGSPDYPVYLNQGLGRFPRVVGTQAGLQAVKKLQQEHANVAQMQPPPGTQLDYIDFDENGKVNAKFKPVPQGSTTKVPEGFVPTAATTNARGDVSVKFGPAKDATNQPDREEHFLNEQLKTYNTEFDRARQRRASVQKSADPDLIKAADADILDYTAKRDAAAAALDAYRKGKAGPSPATPTTSGPVAEAVQAGEAGAAAAAVVQKIASAQEFHSLPSGAEFIDPQGVRRRKP